LIGTFQFCALNHSGRRPVKGAHGRIGFCEGEACDAGAKNGNRQRRKNAAVQAINRRFYSKKGARETPRGRIWKSCAA